MKIAVYFSGNIRTGVTAFPNLRKYFGRYFDDIDFFLHTWDLEDVAPPFLDCYEGTSLLFYNLRNYIPYKLQTSKLQKLNSLYKFKQLKVDIPLDRKQVERPLWVSARRALDLVYDYQTLNNIKYDVVIKMRPDLLLEPFSSSLEQDLALVEKDTVVVCNLQGNLSPSSPFLEDVLLLSDTDTSKVIYEFGSIDNNPHEYLYKYLLDNDKQVKKAFSSRYAIYREHLQHLDPIEDFEKIHLLNLDLYNTIEHRNTILKASEAVNEHTIRFI